MRFISQKVFFFSSLSEKRRIVVEVVVAFGSVASSLVGIEERWTDNMQWSHYFFFKNNKKCREDEWSHGRPNWPLAVVTIAQRGHDHFLSLGPFKKKKKKNLRDD